MMNIHHTGNPIKSESIKFKLMQKVMQITKQKSLQLIGRIILNVINLQIRNYPTSYVFPFPPSESTYDLSHPPYKVHPKY